MMNDNMHIKLYIDNTALIIALPNKFEYSQALTDSTTVILL